MSLDRVVLRASSKINLLLNVFGKAENGLHYLESVVIPTPIFDVIEIKKRCDSEIKVSYSNNLHFENDNVLKIATKIQNYYETSGFEIYIEKNIPESKGLGGSSADAGVVAKGLKKLFNLSDINPEILFSTGSDVTYMYYGGSKIIKGLGETVLSLDLKPRYICVLYDETNSSTKKVYEKFDKIGGNNYLLEDFFKTGKLSNALQNAAIEVEPKIQDNLNLLNDVGFNNVAVTGSGSAVIASSFDKNEFVECVKRLKDNTTANAIAYHYTKSKLTTL